MSRLRIANELPLSITPNQINDLQVKKLKSLLKYLSLNSPYYSNLFVSNKISVNSIKTLNDLKAIPPTTKQMIQERNHDFICVSKEKIIDYVTTSGTLGDPITFPLTDKDLDRLALNEFLSFKCADGNSNEIYQLTATMDRRFMAGMAYFLGARKLGAGIVRVGSGIPEFQWDTIKKIEPTAIIAVPSFLLKIIEYAELNQIDFNSSSIKKAICIGEPIRNDDFSLNTLGEKIKKKWDLKLYSTYASTEMATAFTECHQGEGGHHQPDLIIVEFLDDNNLPVNEGEIGELTVTTLGLEAMPLLRFKTGDLCRHYLKPCKCGRNTLRIGPIIGRKNQMIKYKGTSLYPPSLYEILEAIPAIENYIIEVFTNDLGMDDILIIAGCRNFSKLLEKEIKDHFRAKLRVSLNVEFRIPEEINSLQNTGLNRKLLKFIDKR